MKCRIIYIFMQMIIISFALIATGCGSGGGSDGGIEAINTTTVTGTVLDKDDSPVIGAEAIISSDAPVTVITDSNGKFTAEVEVGEHEIIIKKNNVVIYSGSFSCHEKTTLVLGNINTSYSDDVDNVEISWGNTGNEVEPALLNYCGDSVCGFTVFNYFYVEQNSGEIDLAATLMDLTPETATFYVENGKWYILSTYIKADYVSSTLNYALSISSPSADLPLNNDIETDVQLYKVEKMNIEEYYTCTPPIANMTGTWSGTKNVIESNCTGIIDMQQENNEFTVQMTQSRSFLYYTPNEDYGLICGNAFTFNEYSSLFQGGIVQIIDRGTVAADGQSFNGSSEHRWSDGVQSCEWISETYATRE